MKKLLLVAVVFLGLLTTGCAMLNGWKTDAQACIADPVCMQEATAKANAAKGTITQVAGVVSPLPWIPTVAGSVGGGIALLVYLVLGGKKKEVKPNA